MSRKREANMIKLSILYAAVGIVFSLDCIYHAMAGNSLHSLLFLIVANQNFHQAIQYNKEGK